jgi:hypothetical protein
MTRTTIAVGLLLILLGVGPYLTLFVIAEGTPSFTALIPTFLGIPILVLGLLAQKDSLRMHAMHLVSLLALIGFVLPAGRLAMQLAKGSAMKPMAAASLILMAVLCGTLLLLCVKSFLDARRARARKT